MRKVLANIVKDVTPQPGMLNPLSPRTIEDIRECFGLIAAREAELAREAGFASERPMYTDQEPSAKVVPLTRIPRAKDREPE